MIALNMNQKSLLKSSQTDYRKWLKNLKIKVHENAVKKAVDKEKPLKKLQIQLRLQINHQVLLLIHQAVNKMIFV